MSHRWNMATPDEHGVDRVSVMVRYRLSLNDIGDVIARGMLLQIDPEGIFNAEFRDAVVEKVAAATKTDLHKLVHWTLKQHSLADIQDYIVEEKLIGLAGWIRPLVARKLGHEFGLSQ